MNVFLFVTKIRLEVFSSKGSMPIIPGDASVHIPIPKLVINSDYYFSRMLNRVTL